MIKSFIVLSAEAIQSEGSGTIFTVFGVYLKDSGLKVMLLCVVVLTNLLIQHCKLSSLFRRTSH